MGDSIVTGYPFLDAVAGDSLALDTDADGLPDGYETEIGLDPYDPADAAHITETGYSALEVYLNGVADGTIDKSRYEHLPYISQQPSLPESIPQTVHPSSRTAYDLLGRPVAAPVPAVPYIKDGNIYIPIH